jgi:hypothetical protein
VILGVDPGLATCGWAVLDHAGRVADLGVVLQGPDAELDEAVCRARRANVQAAALHAVAVRYGCTVIGCEAMSFGGPPKARFAMAISVGLSWGGVSAIATALGCELYSVPPKVWERAVQPTTTRKVDYPKLEAALSRYVSEHARESLAAISKATRNHALDAVGIGMFVALRREQADRIMNRRTRLVHATHHEGSTDA